MAKRGAQTAQLGFEIVSIQRRLRQFRAHQLAQSVTHAMHGDRERVAAQVERHCGARIVFLVGALGQEFLQLLEQCALA